jgi:hypothetical protein
MKPVWNAFLSVSTALGALPALRPVISAVRRGFYVIGKVMVGGDETKPSKPSWLRLRKAPFYAPKTDGQRCC